VSYRVDFREGLRLSNPRRRKGPADGGAFPDGETQTRTGDTTIFSRVLYQLSYPAMTAVKR
jgi:hypothetical protein